MKSPLGRYGILILAILVGCLFVDPIRSHFYPLGSENDDDSESTLESAQAPFQQQPKQLEPPANVPNENPPKAVEENQQATSSEDNQQKQQPPQPESRLGLPSENLPRMSAETQQVNLSGDLQQPQQESRMGVPRENPSKVSDENQQATFSDDQQQLPSGYSVSAPRSLSEDMQQKPQQPQAGSPVSVPSENLPKIIENNRQVTLSEQHQQQEQQEKTKAGAGNTTALATARTIGDGWTNCVGSSTGKYGTCKNDVECKKSKGEPDGSCMGGLGVCCVMALYCGDKSVENNTFYANPDFPEPSWEARLCELEVKKKHDKVVQVMIEFEEFELAPPNHEGECITDVFEVKLASNRPSPYSNLRICGQNTGQHMYLDVSQVKESLILSVATSGGGYPRRWSIRIVQMDEKNHLLAPPGCLQYYTDTVGHFRSFNLGRNLRDLYYAICFRIDNGYTGIRFTSNFFGMNGPQCRLKKLTELIGHHHHRGGPPGHGPRIGHLDVPHPHHLVIPPPGYALPPPRPRYDGHIAPPMVPPPPRQQYGGGAYPQQAPPHVGAPSYKSYQLTTTHAPGTNPIPLRKKRTTVVNQSKQQAAAPAASSARTFDHDKKDDFKFEGKKHEHEHHHHSEHFGPPPPPPGYYQQGYSTPRPYGPPPPPTEHYGYNQGAPGYYGPTARPPHYPPPHHPHHHEDKFGDKWEHDDKKDWGKQKWDDKSDKKDDKWFDTNWMWKSEKKDDKFGWKGDKKDDKWGESKFGWKSGKKEHEYSAGYYGNGYGPPPTGYGYGGPQSYGGYGPPGHHHQHHHQHDDYGYGGQYGDYGGHYHHKEIDKFGKKYEKLEYKHEKNHKDKEGDKDDKGWWFFGKKDEKKDKKDKEKYFQHHEALFPMMRLPEMPHCEPRFCGANDVITFPPSGDSIAEMCGNRFNRGHGPKIITGSPLVVYVSNRGHSRGTGFDMNYEQVFYVPRPY